ncbi:3',5'-cyclic-nucleotide phosphodiesterase [Methylobacterium sp. Leaf456]|uniref:hypothetical protein n=1 Tax=Methylobacterium sp. Leaf456 TaxID=1736382 RepID=UPI0006FF7719|nr:hypothetical protein [Methylobacterium sp. Leaf456]KQT58610.1 3',5'-cyclic-nucleotide phosphodiesterase [Methylobacterium sp. Leaf456]
MALKLTSLALVLSGAAALLIAPAQAQQTKRGNENLKKYCTGDYLSYCGNLDPDDPATDQCFKTNWAKLSENCRRAIDAYTPPKDANARKKG